MHKISANKSQSQDKVFDVYNRMLSNRTIFLTGEVNDDKANLLIAQIFYLESDDSSKDIQLIINSPGGWVTAGMAIYDVMNYVKCDIRTICVGQAASMGAILLASGTKGKRIALPNARIMIHQPLGGMEGVVSDIEIHAREIIRIKERLNKILSDATGKSMNVVSRDTDRDFFLSADEALKYGLIDEVSSKHK